MGSITDIEPPFGTFALPPGREAVRLSAHRMGNDRLGKWTISLRRKRAIRGLSGPFDIEVAPGVKARLYPTTNRCEKRALCGVQIWDTEERRALKNAIETAPKTPFTFLDIGANVGLYSLFAHSYAQLATRDIRIIAVEPSADMGARLSVNAAASQAKIELIPAAISTQAGPLFLSDGGGNRGEARLSNHGEAVTAMTLMELCTQTKLPQIDALKLDIEGVDFAVLKQFFQHAPARLHPKLMILELDAESERPLIELTQAHNYLIITRTRMNLVVRKRDQT